MVEYVKWCSSREDLELGSFSRVTLRTRRYSENKVSIISFFFEVSSRILRIMHFLKVILTALTVSIAYVLHPSGVKILLQMITALPALSGGARFLLDIFLNF